MPRPKSTVEDEVFELLREHEGKDLHYPATLKTIYAARNAVYRFNRENGKRFRSIIGDNGVTLTERSMKTAHDTATKEIADILTAAKSEGESDASVLLDRIEEVLKRNFEDNDETEVEPLPRRKRA